MPLNYLNLQKQIKNLADTAVHRQREQGNQLIQCKQVLSVQATEKIRLQEKVEQAVTLNKNYRCAVPVNEPLNAHFPAPQAAADCSVLSADGSQITPNAHEAVFYGLVNVGLFLMRPGSGLAPETRTITDLIYDDENSDEHEIITEDLINLRRDVAERRSLAVASAELPAPIVTLTDGPLELYHEPRENPNYRKYFDEYLDALKDMSAAGTLTAGYIDRPRASLLVSLLELAADSEVVRDPSTRRFPNLTDLALMRPLLAPGERSAVFKMQSSSSKEYTENLELHFFYLNVGSVFQPALARVEIPRWVAKDSASVDLLHTVLLEQSHQTGDHPYPYALLRAHETAVVRLDENEALKDLIQKELLQRGIPLSFDSEKLANKKIGARTRYNS